jgi:polyhydroxybutyrate depolymerase
MLLKNSQYIHLSIIILSMFFGQNVFADKNKLDKREIKIGDFNRSYYIRYPLNHDSQSSFPLVIVLHGGDRKNGDETAERTGFAELADKGNYIAVFPNGFKGKWHDGRLPKRGKAKYIEKQENDILFISELIDYLIKFEQVDSERVYMTGTSNGGMMTMRMACEASEKIAAVAPIIANMPIEIVDQCKPKSKLSFLLMNGTEDPLIPWEGGEIKAVFKSRGKVLSTKKSFDFWLKHNACGPKNENITLANKNTNDRSVIGKTSYDCENSTQAVLYTVRGGGHTLPSSQVPDRPRLLGQKNLDANGAELIWDFLKQQKKHSKN